MLELIFVSVYRGAVRRLGLLEGRGRTDTLDDVRLINHLATIDTFFVVEMLLLENSYDDVFGHETYEAACSVDYRVRIVVRLKGFLALLHVGNCRDHDRVSGHDS